MPARTRRRNRRGTAAAIALTAGITASAALLLSACGSDHSAAAGPAPVTSGSADGKTAGGSATTGGSATATATATGTTPSTATGTTPGTSTSTGTGTLPAAGVQPASGVQPAAASTTPLLNGTAHNGLTISNGTRYVVMNGTRVDFGTVVRDLSWSPDGRKAVFVDGAGDLAISDPDGSGRVVVARNPGGQTWSHPTWRVRKANAQDGYPGANDIIFAVRARGVSRLYGIPATARRGTPTVLSLDAESGPGAGQLPQTGNVWPDAAGTYGTAVYANSNTGEVYIRDDSLRQQGIALTQGSEPALSGAANEYGDSGDIVFVRSVGGHDHLFLEHSTGRGPTYRDLTPHATTDYTEPAFSPDGTTVAARTPGGVVTLPTSGSHVPVRVSGSVGLPAYRA
jgi:hypothetical protein